MNQIRFAVSAGKLFQGFSENLGGQPLAFGKGLSKRAVHVDGVFRSGAEQFRSPDKRVLEHLTAHTGINNRVPVHKRNLTGCQCLGKLIHCRRSLLRGGTRNSGQVSDTLDRINGSLKIYTGCGKRTDISGHFGKVVNRLVRIGVQFIQRPVYLLKVCPFMLSVGKDSLHRADLRFIFLKTCFNRVYRKRRNNPFSRVQSGIGDIGKGCYRHDF